MSRPGAIILCGGQSTRMGRDKACLPFAGETMLTHIVGTVAEVVQLERIVCVAGQGQPLPELPPAVRVVRDRLPGRGPLEGLAVGLSTLQGDADRVLVTPCDVPLIRRAYICFMLDVLDDFELAVPRVDGKWFALSSVCRPTVLPKVEQLLARGERRVRALIPECRTREVTADELRALDPELESLWNCNGPAEYHTAVQQFQVNQSLS